ncbi:MAG: hypothetical protein DRR16_31795 [Candidatus Parabeggiatoa sp. nov. 3]|nr:MAG: hypothetical protein DRR00_25930 [Gammaproteobacteria bacterium]RKZ59179.1 MAG: hypothetical protein DRQ99_24160 [Gammaproteobacteria bacterium]RKZ74873.1 MAG: hypothetical protein DRR16_31795 [Gammaproteobacteria bacterium]
MHTSDGISFNAVGEVPQLVILEALTPTCVNCAIRQICPNTADSRDFDFLLTISLNKIRPPSQPANSFSRQRFCAQNLFHAKVSRSETLA